MSQNIQNTNLLNPYGLPSPRSITEDEEKENSRREQIQIAVSPTFQALAGSSVRPSVPEIHIWTHPASNDPSTDPVALSNQLIQEITNLASGDSLAGITQDLNQLLSLIPNITDGDILKTVASNFQAFDQNRMQKEQSIPQLSQTDDLVVSISTAIINQGMNIPNADPKAIVEAIKILFEKMLAKLDQFSPEQITDLLIRMGALEKYVHSLDQELRAYIKSTEDELEAKIEKTIDSKISIAVQKLAILNFRGSLKDYLDTGEGFNRLMADQSAISWDEETQKTILMLVADSFSLQHLPKWARLADTIETGDLNVCAPDPGHANAVRKQCVDIIKQQRFLSVIKDGDSSVIALSHFLVKQMSSSSIDTYLNDAKQVLSDLVLSMESSNRHNAILNLMGDRVFSYTEILQHYNLDAPLPLIPPTLTTDLLSSPCPYENGKRICDTHFLFPIPVYIPGKEYSVKAFMDSWIDPIIGQAMGSDIGLFSWTFNVSGIQQQGLVFLTKEEPNLNLDTDYQKGKWILLCPAAPRSGSIKSEYRVAWTQEVITARNFWLKRGKDLPYLFSKNVYYFNSSNPQYGSDSQYGKCSIIDNIFLFNGPDSAGYGVVETAIVVRNL